MLTTSDYAKIFSNSINAAAAKIKNPVKEGVNKGVTKGDEYLSNRLTYEENNEGFVLTAKIPENREDTLVQRKITVSVSGGKKAALKSFLEQNKNLVFNNTTSFLFPVFKDKLTGNKLYLTKETDDKVTGFALKDKEGNLTQYDD